MATHEERQAEREKIQLAEILVEKGPTLDFDTWASFEPFRARYRHPPNSPPRVEIIARETREVIDDLEPEAYRKIIDSEAFWA